MTTIEEPDLPSLDQLSDEEDEPVQKPEIPNVKKSIDKTKMWSDLLKTRCPMLHKLVISSNKTKNIDEEKLNLLMDQLNLKPCSLKNEDCLERTCATLWKYYVKRTRARKTKCSPNYNPQIISDLLFSKHDNLSFKPNDLSFLYELNPIVSGDKYVQAFKISKLSGDAMLDVIEKPRQVDIDGNYAMFYLQKTHQELTNYFCEIYEVQHNSQHLYILQEAMMGNITKLIKFSKLQNLLIYSLKGIAYLHKFGYTHNNIKKENLLFNFIQKELVIKWNYFNCISVKLNHTCFVPAYTDPLNLNHDLFAFGIMIYELLFNEHPSGTSSKQWTDMYHGTAASNPISKLLHENIEQLLKVPRLQPLATVAYHFIVNHNVRPSSRWTLEHAFEYLQHHTK